MAVRRLAFLSGDYNPGRDGVANYIQRLAEVLMARGVACRMVALSSEAATRVETYDDPTASGPLPVLRLPRTLARRQRRVMAAKALDAFEPDWVSLHFVCYAFNPKGVVIPDLVWLPALLRPRRVHLLAHELWVGHHATDTVKNRIWRALQRPAVLAMIRRIRPRVLDTTNPYWAERLTEAGLAPGIMPVFSVVPVGDRPADAWLWPALRANGIEVDAATRAGCWIVGAVGSAPAEWPVEATLAELARIGRARSRRIIVAVIGYMTGGTARWDRLKSAYPEIAFAMLGPKPAALLSEFYNSIDFGLNPTPHYLIGKSSVAASMLEHGVPVIASWGDIKPGRSWLATPLAPLVWPLDARLEQRMAGHRREHPRLDMLARVADQFLAELAAADDATAAAAAPAGPG